MDEQAAGAGLKENQTPVTFPSSSRHFDGDHDPSEGLAPRHRRALWGLVLGFYAIAAVAAVFRGRLTGDEGWYLLAAINVFEGKMPYRDFLFTQTPFMPYFYGLFLMLLGKTLLAARLISLALSAGALLGVALLCRRRGGLTAMIVGVSLLAPNLAFIYDSTSVKTQSLTVFLVVMSLLGCSDGRKSWSDLLSVAWMNLAVLTRLSMLPALVLLWLYVFFVHRGRRVLMVACIVLNITLLLGVFRCFDSDGNLVYGTYLFHKEYYSELSLTWGGVHEFLAGFLSNQFLIACCFLVSIEWLIVGNTREERRAGFRSGEGAFLAYLLLSYLATTLIHVTRPLAYPIYQTSNIAFAVVFSALVLSRLVASHGPGLRRPLALAFCSAAVLSMPLQEYVARPSGAGSLDRLAKARQAIAALSVADATMLTLRTELAVESGFALLPHYEMSEFCLLPRASDEQADKRKVVNANRLLRDLSEARASVVCLTNRDLLLLAQCLGKEQLWDILKARYDLRATVPDYGQFFENLYIFQRKKGGQSGRSD